MLSVSLARALRDAGLDWTPARGDHFVMPDRGMDGEVFVLSDMTIEVNHFPGGPVIGFNGTTEWALDSVDQREALWLPGEHQLRERLGDAFARTGPEGSRLPRHAGGGGHDHVVRRGEPGGGLRPGAPQQAEGNRCRRSDSRGPVRAGV